MSVATKVPSGKKTSYSFVAVAVLGKENKSAVGECKCGYKSAAKKT